MAQPAKKTTRTPVKKSSSEKVTDKDVMGAGNVDKIRDILFGNQMRDYERKFSRLEDRIMKEVTRLREESDKRLNSLEDYIKKEIDTLSERQKSEQAGRTQAIKELVAELNKTAKMLDEKLSDLDNQLGGNTRDLRQQILDQSKDLSQEIGRKYDETSAAQERIADELREEKVDRSALSALLTDLALRISDEPLLNHGLEE